MNFSIAKTIPSSTGLDSIEHVFNRDNIEVEEIDEEKKMK